MNIERKLELEFVGTLYEIIEIEGLRLEIV